MRPPRTLITEEHTHFHVISRIVDRRFVIEDEEKEYLLGLLRRLERFAGVKVLTYCLMSNHFHFFLVTEKVDVEMPDVELLRRLRGMYSQALAKEVEWKLKEWRKRGHLSPVKALRAKYLARLGNLSEFMRILKQRFSVWFNRKHDRVGTLWEDRFKSVVVEGSATCAIKVAAYIDLNPVRAGMVEKPEDYRWCGWAEAVAGVRVARRGLRQALEEASSVAWKKVEESYRCVLYGVGEQRLSHDGKRVLPGIPPEKVKEVWEAGGKLSLPELLRCRVRYFSEGLALGSRGFLDQFWERNKSRFGEKRSSGARKMRGGDWEGLMSFRDLQVEPVQPPV